MNESISTKAVYAWALVSPSGRIIRETLSSTCEKAQHRAFDHLFRAKGHWTSGFWKQWDEFVEARAERGWVVRRVSVTVVGGGRER